MIESSAVVLFSRMGNLDHIDRLIFGSFSENLLRSSTHPVLFLTHIKQANLEESFSKKVLFPTDFSDSSKTAFLLFF